MKLHLLTERFGKTCTVLALSLLQSLILNLFLTQGPVQAAPDWGYSDYRYEHVLAIHAGTRRAVAGFGDRLALLDWESEAPLAWLPLPQGRIEAAQFSPDGTQLAVLATPAYSLDQPFGAPRLYWFELPGLTLRASWEHGSEAWLRFDPQGQRLASVAKDQLCLYRAAQPAPVCTRLNAKDDRGTPILGLSFEADGILLQTSAKSEGMYSDNWYHQLWSWGDGEPVKRFELYDAYYHSFYLQQGHLLELLDGRLREYSLPTLEPGPWQPAPDLRDDASLQLTEAGSLGMFFSGQLTLYDYPSLRPRGRLGDDQPRQIDGDAVLMQGKTNARVWSLVTGQPVSVPWTEAGDISRADYSARAEADPERGRLVLQIDDDVSFDWFDLRLGLRRDFLNGAEYNYWSDVCFLPGRRELLALAYYGVENIRDENYPLYDQYDSVRRLTLIDPYGTRRPFAAGRYEHVVGGYRDSNHGVFARGCGALALDTYESADIWDLRSLRKRTVPFAGLYPEALSPDGNWLLGHDSAWDARGLSLIDTRSGKVHWRAVGPKGWAAAAVFGQRHLVALEAAVDPQPATPGVTASPPQRFTLVRQALSPRAGPQTWRLDFDDKLEHLWLRAVSDDGRWILLIREMPGTGKELLLADWEQRRLTTLAHETSALMWPLANGFLSHDGHSQIWQAAGSRLLRWELPTLTPLPALESHAAFPLIQALPDPTGPGIVAIDQIGSLHRLTP